MAERISRRLILLSSAAIGAVYLAGYLDTRSADAGLANAASVDTTATSRVATPPVAAAGAIAQAATSTQTTTAAATAAQTRQSAPAATAAAAPPTVAPATATARPAPTIAPTATAAPSGLRDGTYTGVGDSRRGAIQAALTVKGGRITNVAITGASTQYPVSWISDLPGEVVTTQSYRVDLISGATYSSLAFQGAVRQAIAQAQA
ncbi:MAG: FMN-binding protein [Chloroflexota bacterium]